MREIDCAAVTEAVEKLFIDACCNIGNDVEEAVEKGLSIEESPSGKDILEQILKNMRCARNEGIPACQDTGMSVVFAELGQDVHITGGYLYDAINEGVRRAYVNGFLRKSVVKSPIDRVNTDDNTPAVIHLCLVPGENMKIIAAPKGFGSENMSRIAMLKPSEGIEGIKRFVIDTVTSAGANPCPPIVLGIGIGGTFEQCALLSKKALLLPLNHKNSDPVLSSLEDCLYNEANKTGIGPQGLGGRVTCLKVNILSYPTHIAALPVAVNMQCHACRHSEIIL